MAQVYASHLAKPTSNKLYTTGQCAQAAPIILAQENAMQTDTDPQPTSSDAIPDRIVSDMMQQGWCVYPNFLQRDTVAALRQQALLAWQEGKFRPAGVGRAEGFTIQPEVRSDQVMWLDGDAHNQPIANYFTRMEKLRLSLNQALFLGLFDYEAHFAVYPAGSFYRKHLDQFRGVGLRTVTTTFYLNDDWSPEYGGQLRLYTQGDSADEYVDILPEAGTLVVFLSAEFLHEVLPAQCERLSIAGWFRKRGD